MNKKLIILPILLLLLASCSGSNSSSLSTDNPSSPDSTLSLPSVSGDSSIPSVGQEPSISTSDVSVNMPSNSIGDSKNGTLTFAEVLDVLETAAAQEALYSSGATIKDTQYQGDIVYISDETVEVFSNYSSYSQGTITKTNIDEDDVEDTFLRRSMVVNDRIEINNAVKTFPMFAQVTDYQNDLISNNSYSDSASKVYMVDSVQEALDNNLDSSSYILTDQYPVQASPKVAYNALLFIENNIVGNVYVSQLGKQTFAYTKDNNGIFHLSFEAIFNYDGDWDDGDVIYNTIKVDMEMNETLTRLFNVSYSHTMDDVANNDASDHYFTGIKTEANVLFGTRQAVRGGITDASEYFLDKAEDVAIVASLNGRVTLDGNEIPANASYLWGKAKNYTPAKATNLDLINYGSTNPNVIEFEDDGFLKVKGIGTTTLSFLYFEKGTDDIYRQTIIKKDVTVVTPMPTNISFSYNNDVEGDTLLLGKTYHWETSVTPIQASQSITAISNNPSILEVSVDEDFNLILVAKEIGEATITIASTVDPKLTASKTFTVMDGSQNFNKIISENTYEYEYYWAYQKQYVMTMTFDGNGHGTRVDEVFTENQPVTLTDYFEYEIVDNTIIFSNWQLDSKYKTYFEDIDTKFDSATILNDGKIINTYTQSVYSHKEFNAK